MRLTIRRTMLALVGTAILFALIVNVIQLARSTLHMPLLDHLTIPSRSNTGVVFQAPSRGEYIFEYAAGGFLVYNLPPGTGCDRTSFKCYSAYLVAFRGERVRWSREDLNFPVALFTLGEVNAGWTLEEAERQAVGRRTTVGLDAGEQITLVAGDWRSAYDDNTGDMVLNVYFIPR